MKTIIAFCILTISVISCISTVKAFTMIDSAVRSTNTVIAADRSDEVILGHRISQGQFVLVTR